MSAKVTVRYFAAARAAAGYDDEIIGIAPGTTVEQVVEQFRLPPKQVHLVLVNGHYVAAEQRGSRALDEGDVLAIWPPIAGG